MFFRKKNNKLYFPGEEIKIDRKKLFYENDFDSNANSLHNKYTILAISLFFIAYFIIVIRTLFLSVNGIKIENNTPNSLPQAKIANPISRADIVDRNGNIIATSLPTSNLYANPKKVKNKRQIAAKLSQYIPDMLYEDILSQLEQNRRFVYIKRNLSLSQKFEIYALGIQGLGFEDVEKRIYPQNELFSHIIGKTNIDNVGVSGMELKLEDRLTNSNIALKLSVDIGVQDTVRQKLLEGIKKFDAIAGSAILMNVNNGEIISMVSLPDYNPNINTQANSKNTFNFATKGVYEAGSVFKTFNAALGLESKQITLEEKFDATKPIRLKYNLIKDYRGENRWLDLQEILIHSSNIGSAHISLRVGKEKQRAFLENIGLLSDIADFEVAEKAFPIVPPNWKEETTATISYGYGLSVSPLHIATAFSSLINGGTYYKPTLIKQETQPEGKKVISTQTSKNLIKLLRNVILSGAKKAEVKGYEVAGKTGTANKLVDGKYIDKKVIASFVATFPAADPQYTLMVVLDEPKPSKETLNFVTAGWNAAPTAKEIIENIAPQLNLKSYTD